MKIFISSSIFIFVWYFNALFAQSFSVTHHRLDISDPSIENAYISFEVGKSEIKTGNETKIIDFAPMDFWYVPNNTSLQNIWHFIETDTVTLSSGVSTIAFQWSFNGQNINKLLLPDSILTIYHQIFDVDSNTVLDNALEVIIGEGNTMVYDSTSGQYNNLLCIMGTRQHYLNTMYSPRIIARTIMNYKAFADISRLEWGFGTINYIYDDSSQYYNNDFFKNKLPQMLSNVFTKVKEDYIAHVKINLDQNYPNPFNLSTIINYHLSEKNFVSLIIYNLSGKEVVTLVNEEKVAGNHIVQFNAGNLSSGIYFYKLQTGNYNKIRKFILIK